VKLPTTALRGLRNLTNWQTPLRSNSVRAFLFLLLLENLGLRAAAQGPDASQLVSEVIQNEIRRESEEARDDRLWSYRELTLRDGSELLFEYCQTKHGTLHRLLAINGRPLNPSQRQAEEDRIQKLIKSPDALRAQQKKDAADAEEERKFLRLFPAAFRYVENKREGHIVTLMFTPDPNFDPSGIEERVLHCMSGTMVVDAEQKRLISINGRLIMEVKFWGGLAGYLNAGGTFSVHSQCVAPGDWELKSLDVEMTGKALLFKSISVEQHEVYSSYREVPASLSLAQAAERLQKDASG
jgi:hypothetical protein